MVAGKLRDSSALAPVAQGRQAKFISPSQTSAFWLQRVQLSPGSLRPHRHPTAFGFRAGTWFLTSYSSGYPELVSVDNWDRDGDRDSAQSSRDPPGLAQPMVGAEQPEPGSSSEGRCPRAGD